jgi:hypothetical protein
MKWRTLRPLAAVPLMLVLAAAACAGAEDNGGVASAGTPSAAPPASGSAASGLSQQEKALKFAQCMREHGVPMDDPDPNGGMGMKVGGPGVDQTKIQAAQQACRQYSPFGEGGQQLDAGRAERLRKFAQCMRDNGVPSFPDPDSGMMRIEQSVAADPDFPAAQQKCEKEFLAQLSGAPGTF